MSQPLISVIVPVYNVEDYLRRCVASLCAQTYENLEILLVDDGSPDGSGAICDELAAEDARIRVFHKENGGLSSARNLGLDNARGEYLSFIDSDDWIDPDTYEQFLALIQKYNAPLAYGGNVNVYPDGRQTPALCPKAEECITGQTLVRRMFLWDTVDCSACDKFYHRSLWEGIRFPLGVTCEDVATTYKIALKAEKAAVFPRPFYHYYRNPGSISHQSVTPATFHFAEHTLRMEPEILGQYPGLRDPMGYLKVRALAFAVQQLEIADRQTQAAYEKELRKYRPLLRQEAGFIAKSPLFTGKEKRDFLLMAFGLYQLPRQVYHLLKHSKT